MFNHLRPLRYRNRIARLLWATAAIAITTTPIRAQGAEPTANTATPAPAQDPANNGAPAASADIVVTALKRGTRLQDTPIAIAAVTGQTLANSGVQDIADLRSQVPNLTFVDGGPSNRRVVMRGIQASGEPTVGVYYDETPVTGLVGAGSDAGGTTPELRLFDVNRVEALRGPQGTLYGSGSMGGTLRVIYNKPSYKWGSDIDASLSGTQGGSANGEINGMINAPIVDQKIALRIVGFYKHDSGYIDNTWLNVKNINAEESYGGRAMLRIQPVEQWTIDAAAYYNHSHGDTPSWILEQGKYNTNAETRQIINDDVQLYSFNTTYDFGGIKATGVVSYMNRQLTTQSDVSRFIQSEGSAPYYNYFCAKGCVDENSQPITSFAGYQAYVNAQSVSSIYPVQDMDALTAELRLSSGDRGPVHWTAGGFYSRRVTNVANGQVNADPQTGYAIPSQIDTIRYVYDVLKQEAVFADASWDVTSKLSLSGGARYFKYDKDVIGHIGVPSILVGAAVSQPIEYTSSENGTVVRANLSYKFTRDVLFYFEASQGFRPGGVNQVLGLPASLVPYRSDSLWDYEAGLKTAWFNRGLTANIDVFRIDWTNIQVTQRTPNGAFGYIGNASAARVQGIEYDSTIRPIHGLDISGNATYMTAVLTEDALSPALTTTSSGLKGNRIPYVPKFTAGVGAQYNWPVTQTLNGFVRADASHTGGSYSDFRPTYTYTRYIRGYNLVNARVGVERPDGWGAYIFCTNLFNALAIERATSSALALGQTLVVSAQPRTMGINLRKSF